MSILAGLLLVSARGLHAADEPASAPTDRPGEEITLPGWQNQPPGDQPYVPEQVARALEFERPEKLVLSDVRDDSSRRPHNDQAALLLLGQIARIDPLKYAQFQALENPPVRMLRKYPDDFRYQPIRIDMMVYKVRRIAPGEGLSYSPYWDRDRPVWEIRGTAAAGGIPSDNPLLVLSTVDPTKRMGKPDSQSPQGEMTWARPRRVEFAGVFFRLFRDTALDGKVRSFPVVLAWQMESSRQSAESPLGTVAGVIGGLVLLGFIVWFFARRLIRTGRMLARRDQPRAAPAPDGAPQAPISDDAGEIDPDLLAAAEEYYRAHPDEAARLKDRARQQERARLRQQPPPPSPEEEQGDVDPQLRRAVEESSRRKAKEDDDQNRSG